MRFIIHELPYEKPARAGMWRYEQNGVATGAVETWRLTDASDGYQFVRIDLDARTAQSGRSLLYHLTVDEHGEPLQLRYRLWGAGTEVTGTALLEESNLILIAEQDGIRSEEVVSLPPGFVFWFPSSTALGLLASRPLGDELPGLVLQLPENKSAVGLQLLRTSVSITKPTNQSLLIRWQDQTRTLWLDEDGWPRLMVRQDGLTAVETQPIRYQNQRRKLVLGQ